MWKSGLTEAGTDALLGSLGAEIGTGQIELVASELALFGIIMGVKKIKEHHQEKKSAKQAEEQRKADQQAKEKKDAEDAEQARLEEIARQQEQARIDAEKQAEIDRQQHQAMEEAKIENAVANVQSGLAMAEYDREQRIHELEIEHNLDNQDNGWQMPIPPPQPNPYPQPRPNNGGGGGPNRPDNGGNQANNQYSSNPYYDLISQIAKQIQTQKNQEADKKEEENKDKPVIIDPTDPANQTEGDEILDNQHLIQQELEATLGALGEQQLTQEEMLVQLESIEKMIDDQIPDQVKMDPYSVFSSDIVAFNQM